MNFLSMLGRVNGDIAILVIPSDKSYYGSEGVRVAYQAFQPRG